MHDNARGESWIKGVEVIERRARQAAAPRRHPCVRARVRIQALAVLPTLRSSVVSTKD